MKSRSIILSMLACSLLTANIALAKKKDGKEKGYEFTSVIQVETSPVKDQASSGTCWSYATASFLETEMIRLGKGIHDLSEMFFVRLAYPEKAEKYLRYHGLTNFSEGGQGHDVTNVIAEYGMVPEEVYDGLNYGLDYHRHGEMSKMLKGILDNSLAAKKGFTGKSIEVVDATLDIYLGEVPDSFIYNEKEYTPKSFANEMGIDASKYVEFTSYDSYAYYEAVDLELPDNWSHDKYYNIPLEDLMQIMEYAFANNYSVNWDGDVSDKGFSHSKNIAIVPEDNPVNMDESERLKWESATEKEQSELLYDFDKPCKEKQITPALRQSNFDKFRTTDDHLMHLVGTAKDQNGSMYYLTKNSWADDSNDFGGYLYMSKAYFMLNTTAIQIHKDAIPAELKAKLNL